MTNTATLAQTATDAARQVARDFAAALAETPAFLAFEEASERLVQDAAAQAAIAAYQQQQQALRAEMMVDKLSSEERAELQGLYAAMTAQPAVAAYLHAQTDLQALCQEAAGTISAQIGLNFAACKGGCC